ncbi:2-hydroxyacid dehydrogenase [Peredibacter starrii]|uniref:2-hydroxyacid dehydrogenase n=1 Tax=Peredibacter starrii TaxID=28202 RepID=A0AAX4HT85_9BACT|nr:2-hydroxyacid dehydrogenase [Peredibacter starrii]WPU66559.1 2-hydroxyacid dehydrogenase [Peredibacter starrii]
MKIAFFDTHAFERPFFERVNATFNHSISFFEPRLTYQTASLAQGYDCICSFVNDRLTKETIQYLHELGIQLLALRSAGFNHVDLVAASDFGIKVVRVPEYSPFAVAEYATGLILTLNRKIHRANTRVHEGNFSLNGLMGFDLHNKIIGIIGTGKIGTIMCRIMNGFGCQVLAYDTKYSVGTEKNFCRYVSLEELISKSDIISLHVPLTPETHHMINEKSISQMKRCVMLINTGRGALIDTKALINALKSGQIGYAGLDVYEEEEGIFFEDLSEQVIQDDTLARLLTFPNVVLTSHQAFLTKEAISNIAQTTLQNISDFEKGKELKNEVCSYVHVRKKEGD